MPPCISSCTVVVCLHCEGLLGIFFFFLVRCDELSDFPPSRLKVQHIPGCTGQYDFNLFSQAGSTDTILFGIPVPLHCETFNCVGASRVAAIFLCACFIRALHLKTSEPHASYDIFQGHHTGRWHTQLCPS